MPDPRKRIVIDGVDFSQVVRFPRILRAVPAALQPPRMLIAFFLVLLLLAVGRTWDGATEARAHPAGITYGTLTVNERSAAQPQLQTAVRRYVATEDQPEGEPSDWPLLDAGEVLRMVQQGYREQRDTDLEDTQLDRADQRFRATVAAIDEVRPRGSFEAVTRHVGGQTVRIVRGVLFLQPVEIFEGFKQTFVDLPRALWQHHLLFTLIYGTFALLVLAVGGGALCRIAACEISGRQKLRVIEAWQFSLVHWPRLVLAIMLPLVLAAVLAALIVLPGVIMNVPGLNILGAVLYGLFLLIGLLIAFLLLVYALGFGLLLPAVACENCDAADAQQRAYAYVLQRPLHLVGYGIMAVIGLALGYLVVSLFAVTMLNITGGLFGTLTGSAAMSAAVEFDMFNLAPVVAGDIYPNWHTATAAWFIGFWQSIVVALVAAYVVSYFFSAATHVYLLMRQACDGQDPEEIWYPGLVPGTLAPMPPTRVETAATKPKPDQPEKDDRK